MILCGWRNASPLLTKRPDVIPPYLANPWTWFTRAKDYLIALELDNCIDSTAEFLVRFQGDQHILTANLAASHGLLPISE